MKLRYSAIKSIIHINKKMEAVTSIFYTVSPQKFTTNDAPTP